MSSFRLNLFRASLTLLMVFLGGGVSCLFAQSPQSSASASNTKTAPPPIADNSFLVEEAYNQEAGVVQHISTFIRTRNGDFAYAFTQEWPVKGQRHQFSYTIPLYRTAGPGSQSGIGDLALNYRYQLVNQTRFAVAPRATLLLPTGSEQKGLGAGGTGFQFNVPISILLSRKFVAHTNAGTTLTPHARNDVRAQASTHNYFVGQSVIWLAKPRFNVMMESLYEWRESVVANNLTRGENSFLLNPGVRWAYNFRSGLQVVPGVSVPLGVGPSLGERAILFYLSFEHPFRKQQ